MKIQEHNIETGEIVVRDMTPEELNLKEMLKKATIEEDAIKMSKNEKRQTALAKLETLGLTTDDLSALGL